MSDTIATALAAARVRLAAAGCADPARDARALVAWACALRPDRVALEGGQALTAAHRARLDQALTARAAHQPVAQIIGERAFWGRAFEVTGDVLDPRPETESLIAAALEGPVPKRLLDLGTGSSCIAVTLAAEWPGVQVVATDRSAAALRVAARNAARHGVAARVSFLAGDWYAPVTGLFDLIVSNPPYIPQSEVASLSPDVRDWEPHAALTPGGDGLDAYRALAARLADHLAPGGRFLAEFGLGQGDRVREIFSHRTGLDGVLIPDMTGRDRIFLLEDAQNAE